jgi:crotonobetainyl-CoA:carnitine CoA-transferase CaiB-like acyl-CoA transferase
MPKSTCPSPTSLYGRPNIGHKYLGISQDVPNAENRHIRLVGQPVTLSRTPSKMAARPPEFGEQTAKVLAEFGFGADEIVVLKQGKVV